SSQEGNLSEQYLVEGICVKEHLSEYQEGERETPSQSLELLPVSNPISSSQASKNPDSAMEQDKMLPVAEDGSDDPLSLFEIGDRVLVRQTQPGTLMFKGRTCFDSGHWAGVALDRAAGDHAGTYKGVKYFECAQHCGVFVRPDEISHISKADKNDSSFTRDEDSDSYDDDEESFKKDCKYPEVGEQRAGVAEQKAEDTTSAGGSEVSEKQPRSCVTLWSGKGQKLLHSNHYKCGEYHHQNNLKCLGLDKEKAGLVQLKQGMLANAPPKENNASHADGINMSKNVCCSLEDQKRNKFTDDITAELSKKLLFDALIAFSETAQHKYKSAFEKDVMNYIKGLRQEDSQKQFLIKENPVASLTEQSAKVPDFLLHDFSVLSIHGCHTVAERIVAKFVDDAVKEYKKIKRKQGVKLDKTFPSSSETSPTTLPFGAVFLMLQVIFDLTHELLHTEYQATASPNTFPWLKENLRSCCSRCHYRRTDVDEVKTFVQGEIIKIMNLERNDAERKRRFLNMTKYGNCERDRVDLILIQELHKEEPQWTSYDDDELTVKMSMTEEIFNSLILDTVRVLNNIYLRKASV
ncbi:UNVERIFIED_CONTAM: hypothetical protein H355_006766, partial [Colinus virginianus]